MAETTYYDSPMTGAELDEAFAGLARVEQSVALTEQNAETAQKYGQIVADNTQGISQISENLEEILSAADNARAAAQSAGQAADSATEAEEAARQAQQIAQGALGWYATEYALQSVHPTGANGQWAIIGSTDTIWTWDSDTGAWVDSGDQVDLSNYYTKSQAKAAFAPTNHAGPTTTYGVGSSGYYGHVKLSDTPGTQDLGAGTAATPYGVQNAINAVTVGGFNVSNMQVTNQHVRQSGRVVVVDLQVENYGAAISTGQFLLGYVTGVSLPSYDMQSSGGQGPSQFDIGSQGNAYTYIGTDGSVYVKTSASVMHIHVHFVYIADEPGN